MTVWFAVGCLIRGFAPVGDMTALFIGSALIGFGGGNLWTVVAGLVSCTSLPEERPLFLSGFLVQVTTLRISGKLVYPPWNYVLHLLVRFIR